MFKGGACTNCRKRKIRCDGARPRCRACCTSSEQFHDCEYADSGVTPSQRLEEQIAALEAKVHELETQPSPRRFVSSPSAFRNPGFNRNERGTSPEAPLSGELHQKLMHIFMQYTTDLAFFLNTERFLGSFITRSDRATHALLNTIYLWGIHLSPEPLRQYEPQFLSKALQSISHGMAGAQAAGLPILHMIQALVLIAQYFFRNSRILEGRYRMTTAHSLAIGARLHTIRSVESSPTSSIVHPPLPVDAIEEGERINAFWTVVILNTCWTSVDGTPSTMIYTDEPGLRIDTPWPEDMDTYVMRGIPNDLTGSQTVERFLRSPNTGTDNSYSWMALHAKASILFERATQVGSAHWKNISTHSPNAPRSSLDFIAIDSAIQTLSQGLAARPQSPSVLHLLVHLLIDAATIRLHEKHVQSHYRVISSARDIVRVIAHYSVRDRRQMVIDPILAPLSMVAFHVLVNMFKKSPAEEFKTELRILTDAIGSLSSCCPMMNVQATQAYSVYNQLIQ